MPELLRTAWVATTVFLLIACGGRVDDEREPGTSSGSGAASGTGTGSGSAPGNDHDWSSPLSECVPGFSLADAGDRSCNWTANGKCFEKRADACGCECRRTGGSVCSSGFPEPHAGVEVDCF